MRLLLLVVLFLSGSSAFSQGPVLKYGRTLSEFGVPAANAPAKSPTEFKDSNSHPGLDLFLAELGLEGDERAATKAALLEVIVGFTKELKANSLKPDVAAAYAATLTILKTLADNQAVSEDTMDAFLASLQSAMNVPDVKNATDKEKEEAYDYALSCMGMALVTAQALTGADAASKTKQVADAFCMLLVGAPTSQLELKGGKLILKGKASPKPTTVGKGIASGFSYSKPAGWTEESGWISMRKRGPRENDTDVKGAHIRFLDQAPKDKNGGDILRALWAAAVPKEISVSGGMVFRRYVGDRLPAWFVTGKGREKGKEADSIFTIMIVDCGPVWQPVVVAQTYEDVGQFKAGVDFSAQYSWGESADLAEQLISTFKCAATAGTALVDTAALAGKYHFGNAASMDYVNIYTGASASSYVSYGGDIELKPDGTFIYHYSSASSTLGSAAAFGKVDGKGRWTIEGDKLVARYSEYKQWTSSGSFPSEIKNKVATYIIAGVTNFADGVKICVFIEIPPNRPVNAVTVGDRSYWYSTKKQS